MSQDTTQEIININENAASDSFRWGIIGFGKIALAHALGIRSAGHRLTCFSTSNALIQTGDARALKCNLGIDGYRFKVDDMFASSDYRDLLRFKNVDGFIICAPTLYHAEIALAVAAAGKHCLIEKPITMDPEKAQEVINVFEQSSGKVAVNQVLAGFPAFDFLLTRLKEMDMQDLASLEMRRNVSWSALEEEKAIAKDTGFVPDLGIHDLNLLLQRFEDLGVEIEASEWVHDMPQHCMLRATTQQLTDEQTITLDVGVSRRHSTFAHSWELELQDGSSYWFDGKDVWYEEIADKLPQKVELPLMSTEQVFGRILGIAEQYFTGKAPDCSFLNAQLATQTLRVFESDVINESE